MDPKIATLFYLAAIACWLLAVAHPQAGPGRLWVAPIRWVAAGLLLAMIPVVWNSAVAGW